MFLWGKLLPLCTLYTVKLKSSSRYYTQLHVLVGLSGIREHLVAEERTEDNIDWFEENCKGNILRRGANWEVKRKCLWLLCRLLKRMSNHDNARPMAVSVEQCSFEGRVQKKHLLCTDICSNQMAYYLPWGHTTCLIVSVNLHISTHHVPCIRIQSTQYSKLIIDQIECHLFSIEIARNVICSCSLLIYFYFRWGERPFSWGRWLCVRIPGSWILLLIIICALRYCTQNVPG